MTVHFRTTNGMEQLIPTKPTRKFDVSQEVPPTKPIRKFDVPQEVPPTKPTRQVPQTVPPTKPIRRFDVPNEDPSKREPLEHETNAFPKKDSDRTILSTVIKNLPEKTSPDSNAPGSLISLLNHYSVFSRF